MSSKVLKKYKLCELAEITSSKRIFLSDYTSTGIPFYRSKEIIQKSLGENINERLFISENRFFEIKNKFGSPQNGDLLISAVGERAGIPYVIKNDEDFYFKDGNLIWFRNIDKRLNIDFLYYWLKSIEGKNKIESLMIGSAQKALTIIALKEFEIDLPTIENQNKIVSILSSLDDKIELNRQTNYILEEIAQTLFKEICLPKGDELPEGWREGKLEELGKIICGKTPSKEVNEFFGYDIPFIKIPSMHNKVFVTSTDESLSILGAESQKSKYILPYSIVVSCIATVGLVSITSQLSQTNQQINSIIPQNSWYTYFLYFKIKVLENTLKDLGSGGSATLNLNTSTFSQINIEIPPEYFLKNFQNSVSPLFEKILQNENENQTLTTLRDSLLPKLMKGEIEI